MRGGVEARKSLFAATQFTPCGRGVPFANFDGTCVVERRVLATAEGGQSDTLRVVDDVSWAVGTAICLSDRKDKDRLAIKNKFSGLWLKPARSAGSMNQAGCLN